MTENQVSDPPIVTPEEAQRLLALGGAPVYERLAHTVATEPDRVKTARVESYNQGYVDGYHKADEGELDRTRAAVVRALRKAADALSASRAALTVRADAIENGADL